MASAVIRGLNVISEPLRRRPGRRWSAGRERRGISRSWTPSSPPPLVEVGSEAGNGVKDRDRRGHARAEYPGCSRVMTRTGPR